MPKKAVKKVAGKKVAKKPAPGEESEERQTSTEYVDGYCGKTVLDESSSPWTVLPVVREAMRAEHGRFDWLKFYIEYCQHLKSEWKTRRDIIWKYAPNVKLKT